VYHHLDAERAVSKAKLEQCIKEFQLESPIIILEENKEPTKKA